MRPDAEREEGPEELVGHHPVVAEPVGVRAVERARPRVPVDAGVEAELPAELVAQVREDGVLVGRVDGPEDDGVPELRKAEPAVEKHQDAVGEDVVACVDGVLPPEVIREGLLGGHLVHVSAQGVAADLHLPEVGPADEEALARRELAPVLGGLGDRLWAGWTRGRHGRAPGGGLAQQELAAAAVRDPHPRVVVAPGLAQQAGRGAGGLHQRDTRRRVGRADLALARLRRADEGCGGGRLLRQCQRGRQEAETRGQGSRACAASLFVLQHPHSFPQRQEPGGLAAVSGGPSFPPGARDRSIRSMPSAATTDSKLISGGAPESSMAPRMRRYVSERR